MTSHMATKADVSQLESSLIKWLVGTLLAVALLTLTIARFVKSGASRAADYSRIATFPK